MPHQCLKCGSVFKDGSPAILRGCPECKGTRFFYTEKPMSDDERSRLKEQANKDIKYLIQEMLTGEGGQGKLDDQYLEKELFLKLKAEGPGIAKEDVVESKVSPEEHMEKLEKMMTKKPKFAQKVTDEKKKEVEKEDKPEPPPPPEKEEEVVFVELDKEEDKVDVIRVKEKGVYEIDLERLMDNNPIIVQKNGTFLVHLPSVFEKARGRKEETT